MIGRLLSNYIDTHMKTKAIFLASVLLVGCQTSKVGVQAPVQHAQSLSSAGQESEAGEYTNSARVGSARWLDSDSDSGLAQQDLWNFISDELKMKVPENSRIREQKQKYLKNKSYLHDVTLRAEPYMYLIVEQIKKRNMPMELVLLPIVESAFDPHATSSANAAGLWQIVPSTGRNYGLKQNQWYDGRRDVVASTKAALDMMERLNKMFDGDWLLTVAAYNSGEGRVMQAVKANKAKGKPTNFWALSLPRETSIYVPKMLALGDLIKNSKKYGINLPDTDKDRALARVDVGQQIELTQAAEMAGMSLTKLKSFNSGYKRNVTAPTGHGPRYIMLPKAHAEQLKDSLADTDIAAVQPTKLAQNSTKSASSSQYKVRPGDTLSTIAKRLNIKTSDLQSWNNLSTKSTLKVGQTLQLASNTTSSNSITYQVRKGDSFASIAKRHGVNTDDVMRWNSVVSKANKLLPGLKLTLFVNGKSTPDA
ncbi:membrane-bound lytic murein transglycosylase D [Yersinia enterocolitica]|nr:membrane-bound lytic murein transglycosylase Dprecursor [Yersinia enterocolitica (type O:9) str. YE212/02]CCV37286.1 membrane-bound lytic murein transglycosylase Dprecursor [Yersinia enterocolitica (type O:9) str. YE56/03]CNC54599.1 membrane-bound lytic murein transglycosylase D [Yersinia enterocolitica]CNC63162.1 membrane-bound lytic murein transglycosylase D [Yersinia enterocolitica]CNC72852.1 membrane-bound lytic murein transglycosylase D [Yersinia enterocolitica]